MIRIQIHVDERVASGVGRFRKLITNRRILAALAAVAVTVPVVAIASPLTIPNSFTADTVISSSEMNANFAAIVASVDDNDSRVTALEANIVLNDCTWAYSEAFASLSATATCAAGSYAVSGGCSENSGVASRYGRPVGVSANGDPITAGTGWQCQYETSTNIAAYAFCCAP